MKTIVPIAAFIATITLLASCAQSSAPSPQNDSVFTYLLDRKSNWAENKLEQLPPLPQTSDLLAFEVSRNTPLQFFIDANSLSVGTDGVVRYAIVITSPAGARNINYEGIRCNTYEWRQYAALNADRDAWDQAPEIDWRRIENGDLNAYQAALYQDYFCTSKAPAGTSKTILQNLRLHRTL